MSSAINKHFSGPTKIVYLEKSIVPLWEIALENSPSAKGDTYRALTLVPPAKQIFLLKIKRNHTKIRFLDIEKNPNLIPRQRL